MTRNTTQYKWDAQQECYIPHEKAMLAMGHAVGRKVGFMVLGALPMPVFQFAYRQSTAVKRIVWWLQS